MTVLKVRNGNNWDIVHYDKIATEENYGVSKIATYDDIIKGDDDTMFITPKKFHEFTDHLPTTEQVVHIVGDEEINGVKTFKKPIHIETDENDGRIITKFNNITLGTIPTTNNYAGYLNVDSNGNQFANCNCGYYNNGEIGCHFWVSRPDIDDSIQGRMGIYITSDGTKIYTQAPTPNAGNNSKEIATTEWCSDITLSTNLVHRNGNETINDTKVFTSSIYRKANSQDYTDTTSTGSFASLDYISVDKNNKSIGAIYSQRIPTSTQTNRLYRTFNPNDTSKYADLNVYKKDNGDYGVTISGNNGTNICLSTASSSINDNTLATKGWVNNPEVSKNLVHRSGDETIDGSKTFSSTIYRKSSIDTSTTSGEQEQALIQIKSSNNDELAMINATRSGTQNTSRLRVINQAGSGDKPGWADVRIVVTDNADAYGVVSCGTGLNNLSENKVSSLKADNTIPTMGWVNNPETSTNVVHRSGDETIAGNKTFNNDIICNDDLKLSGQYYGQNISSQTLDANNLWIKVGGSTKIYYTTSDGGTTNISNLPNTRTLKLISETVRYISESDYLVYQTAIQGNIRYERTCTNGSWSSWTNENNRISNVINNKFQVVSELPANPQSDVYYFISEPSTEKSIIPNYTAYKDISSPYTATEDGWIWWRATNSGGVVKVNNIDVGMAGNYTDQPFAQFLVGKGDVITSSGHTYFRFIPFR